MPRTIPPSAKPVEIEDIGSNPAPERPIGEMIERWLYRRGTLRGIAGVAAVAALAGPRIASRAPAQAHSSGTTPDGGPSSLSFPELRHQMAQGDAVAEGYEIQTLIRWGDPMLG